MPKTRDLGINFIPETMRPPEVGPGGGCHTCTYSPAAFDTCTGTGNCPNTTAVQYQALCTANCPNTTAIQYQGLCTGNCPNTTVYTPQMYQGACTGNCPNTTVFTPPQYQGACTAMCPNTTVIQQAAWCTPCPFCGAPCNGTTAGRQQEYVDCTCDGTTKPPPYYGRMTRDAVNQIKAHLQQRMEELEEYAKNLGPRTAEEIDARERELRAELEQLSARRKEIKKEK